MSAERPDLATLSAYVDGELDAEAAARVAYAAARDPATAAQIAQLAKLKAVTPEVLPEPRLGRLAAALAQTSRARRPAGLRGRAVAAALALGIAVLATLVLVGDGQPSPKGLLSLSVAMHRAWSSNVEASAEQVRPASVMRGGFAAPDLSAAQLRLVTGEAFDYAARTVLHFGYAGTRGCRLSLFVHLDPAGALGDDAAGADLRTAAWTHQGIFYLVIADGMDEQHFRTVAAALQRYSIDRAPLDRPAAERLAESRLQSKPCPA
jgi:anti-sigma factor RsiW